MATFRQLLFDQFLPMFVEEADRLIRTVYVPEQRIKLSEADWADMLKDLEKRSFQVSELKLVEQRLAVVGQGNMKWNSDVYKPLYDYITTIKDIDDTLNLLEKSMSSGPAYDKEKTAAFIRRNFATMDGLEIPLSDCVPPGLKVALLPADPASMSVPPNVDLRDAISITSDFTVANNVIVRKTKEDRSCDEQRIAKMAFPHVLNSVAQGLFRVHLVDDLRILLQPVFPARPASVAANLLFLQSVPTYDPTGEQNEFHTYQYKSLLTSNFENKILIARQYPNTLVQQQQWLNQTSMIKTAAGASIPAPRNVQHIKNHKLPVMGIPFETADLFTNLRIQCAEIQTSWGSNNHKGGGFVSTVETSEDDFHEKCMKQPFVKNWWWFVPIFSKCFKSSGMIDYFQQRYAVILQLYADYVANVKGKKAQAAALLRQPFESSNQLNRAKPARIAVSAAEYEMSEYM